MGLVYSIGIFLYGLIIRIASLFSKKAKKFIQGRSDWKSELRAWRESVSKPVVWVHCSSLGEYEMSRPVLPYFKQMGYEVLLSFYSPSGYENFKENDSVSKIIYLPLDTNANARAWFDILKPDAGIFVKYDFWYRVIGEARKRGVPMYLINGLFRTDHIFFRPYGDWFLNHLAGFKHLFLINESSQHLLYKKGIENTTVTGDLRYDRVAEICKSAAANPIIEQFKNGQKMVIGGSSWQPEERILRAVSDFFPDQKILIAPHDIKKEHIREIRKLFKGRKCTTYSRAKDKNLAEYQILIIDNIGMLATAYQYADIAIVGGAFGKGLHNVLEAATFGVPLYFGPNIKKFPEASEMVEKGLAYSISHHDEFIRAVDRIRLDEGKNQSGELAAFMRAKQGSAAGIKQILEEELSPEPKED